jgi:hypothetical protein
MRNNADLFKQLSVDTEQYAANMGFGVIGA